MVCLSLQAYIESDIQKYSPAPGDLAYPEKLIIGVRCIGNVRLFAAPVNTFNLLNTAANNSSNSHLALDPDVSHSFSLTLC